MPAYTANTNYQIDGADIGNSLVTREYFIDVYPSLAAQFKTAGLWIWGYGEQGMLGDNSYVNRSSPVQTVSGGTNWKEIASFGLHNAGIKTDGSLWLWGRNTEGQLGTNNNNTWYSSPVQTVSGGTNWKNLAKSAYAFMAAIKTDGTLWVWGYNDFGQLGDNSRTHRSSPVQTVSGGTNWKQVSGGVAHTAAIKTDGSLWMWGENTHGRLGTNDRTHRSSPVQTVSGGTNWKQVVCANWHTIAIKTDGTLWTWGYNGEGQLGDNTITHRSSPVQTVAGGTNWAQIGVTNFSTAGIKTDGSLWLWGRNTEGQLGDNTITHRSSPVQTVAGGTNWKQVSCGVAQDNFTTIKTDGTLWSWGYGDQGRLGDNSNVHRSSPVQTVAGGTNWKSCMANGGIRDDSDDPI